MFQFRAIAFVSCGPWRHTAKWSTGNTASSTSSLDSKPEQYGTSSPAPNNKQLIIVAFLPKSSWVRWRLSRRDLRVTRSNCREIFTQLCACLPDGPADSSVEKIQEKRIPPIFWPITHGHIKYPAFTVLPRPGDRVRLPLVTLAFHTLGVERQKHVDIGSKIFQRIPFLVKGHR